MKYNIFTFKNNMLYCWRLGPMNAQKQIHYSKDVVTPAGRGTHKPPIARGIWAFPYPHYDLFFCWHQWKRHLPKKYQNPETLEDCDIQEKLLKEIRKKFKPSTFYASGFYSHIFPNKHVDYDDWHYWESVRDWANVAKGELISHWRDSNIVCIISYGKDHLEIFVPNYAIKG